MQMLDNEAAQIIDEITNRIEVAQKCISNNTIEGKDIDNIVLKAKKEALEDLRDWIAINFF